MKTQLIPLASHDDLISIRDRMSWAKTPRILLVWPKSERIPLRPLDLKVLQRHATSLGAQLGLVTRHRRIRREAQALGIPVFISTGRAQRNPWPLRMPAKNRMRSRPRQDLREKRNQIRARDESWLNFPAVRIGFFSLGVLAVLVVVFLFIPQAQVVLTPETRTQTTTLPILADPSIDTVFITGSIPSREIRLIVDGSRKAAVTGKIPLPQGKAEGVVTFRNLTEAPVSIPAGTVLTSTGLPGVRFLTSEAGELEAGLEATVDVPVQAESPGATGNVKAGTILAIEGDLGLRVTVNNAEPTTGGSNRMVDAASEKDLSRLREDVLKTLEEKALVEMKALLAPGDEVFVDTLNVEQILEENFDPPPGQPGKNVNLTMRVEFSAFYAAEKDLTELAGTVLNASLPEGFIPAQSQLSLEPLSNQQTDDQGLTSWSIRASRQLEKKLDTALVVPLVQGRNPARATMRLQEAFDLPGAPEIHLSPAWWPWLPLIPFNISVEIN